MNGQLVEDESATDLVWLSNLDEDIGEQINMKDARPDVTGPLTQVAESWRAEIEKRWERDFAQEYLGTT